ncbi:hypothetical protein ACJX0J_031107, partial [Zea mays]
IAQEGPKAYYHSGYIFPNRSMEDFHHVERDHNISAHPDDRATADTTSIDYSSLLKAQGGYTHVPMAIDKFTMKIDQRAVLGTTRKHTKQKQPSLKRLIIHILGSNAPSDTLTQQSAY